MYRKQACAVISRGIAKGRGKNHLSWVDLAALVFLLWAAVAGYLEGLQRSLQRLGLTMGALLPAYLFYKPLLLFLNQEWQAEEMFVGWYLPRAHNVLAAAQQKGPFLPPLAGSVMRFLSPEAAVLPVSAGELPLLWGKLLLQFFSYLLFVLLCTAFFRLLLSLRGKGKIVKNLTEKDRLWGLFAGSAYGLFLLALISAFLDSLSLLFASRFWEDDFYGTYLVKTAAYLLGKIFGG